MEYLMSSEYNSHKKILSAWKKSFASSHDLSSPFQVIGPLPCVLNFPSLLTRIKPSFLGILSLPNFSIWNCVISLCDGEEKWPARTIINAMPVPPPRHLRILSWPAVCPARMLSINAWILPASASRIVWPTKKSRWKLCGSRWSRDFLPSFRWWKWTRKATWNIIRRFWRVYGVTLARWLIDWLTDAVICHPLIDAKGWLIDLLSDRCFMHVGRLIDWFTWLSAYFCLAFLRLAEDLVFVL